MPMKMKMKMKITPKNNNCFQLTTTSKEEMVKGGRGEGEGGRYKLCNLRNLFKF